MPLFAETHENWWPHRARELAAGNVRDFLYNIYRGGPFGDLEVYLFNLPDRVKLKRIWAIDPSHDGLATVFNLSSGDGRSLIATLADYKKKAHNGFAKRCDLKNSAGAIVEGWRLDEDKVRPEILIEAITATVELARALSKRISPEDAAELNDCIVICENLVLPALKKLPADKSFQNYPKFQP